MGLDTITIVAIPAKDQPVWKVSSDKIPHLTILSLGDLRPNFDVNLMIEYVGHTAKTTMHRFSLSSNRRGTLGSKDADVLFFDLSEWNLKELARARSHMLADSQIKTAYQSVEQFPSWIPHLTLGYPTSPAKEVPEAEFGLSWVEFDKIAVWIGDYEGPEFLLEREEFSGDVAMSDTIESILSHHGVKGMKWGVRRSATSSSPGSEDHQRAVAVKAKAKKGGGTKALSNKDLQDAITRMNLERQYKQLNPTAKQKAAKFVSETLLGVGKQQATKLASDFAAQQVAGLMKK